MLCHYCTIMLPLLAYCGNRVTIDIKQTAVGSLKNCSSLEEGCKIPFILFVLINKCRLHFAITNAIQYFFYIFLNIIIVFFVKYRDTVLLYCSPLTCSMHEWFVLNKCAIRGACVGVRCIQVHIVHIKTTSSTINDTVLVECSGQHSTNLGPFAQAMSQCSTYCLLYEGTVRTRKKKKDTNKQEMKGNSGCKRK